MFEGIILVVSQYLYRFILAVFMLTNSFTSCAEHQNPNQYSNLDTWKIDSYTTITLKLPTENFSTSEFELDEFALLGQANISAYINPFFEVEFSNQPLWEKEHGVISHLGHFDLERLYNEFHITNKFKLRIGKVLAPVGEWNQAHADPLIESINRPLTTYWNFSEFISGLSMLYKTESSLLPNVHLYYQPWKELLPKTLKNRATRYQNVKGLNLNYGDDFLGQVGLSVQHADLTTRNESQTLYSIDGQYDFGILKINSQVSYIVITGTEKMRKRNYERAGFLQFVLPIKEGWAGVIRGETFLHRDSIKSQKTILFGVNYRPNNAVAWKFEYVSHYGEKLKIQQGFYGSFGIMF